MSSSQTIGELAKVLSYPKFALTSTEQTDVLLDYLSLCQGIVVSNAPPVPDCRDVTDRAFLELAMVGRADAIVTGDGDLLALAPQFSVPILMARDFRERVAKMES